MKSGLFILLLAVLATSAFAQYYEGDFFDVTVIDPFDENSETLVIIVGTTADHQETFTSASDIVGTERDLALDLISGYSNLVLSAGVSNGEFTSAAPNGADGTVTLQYDGVDGSMNLVANGLTGLPEADFTSQSAFAFRVQMETDITTVANFFVYSGSSTDFCSSQVTIPGGDEPFDFIIEYSAFSNTGSGCDFSDVGAFELVVDLGDNVDVIIRQIATYAPFTETGCVCPPCPEFTCLLVFDDDPIEIYYVTSDFDDDGGGVTTRTTTNFVYITVSDDGDDDQTFTFYNSPDSPSSRSSFDDGCDDDSSANALVFSVTALLASIAFALF